MIPPPARRLPLLGALCALLLRAPLPAAAQAACDERAELPAAPAAGWPSPLDRPVSLSVRDSSLRSALDRLSAAAQVRLSYSPDVLPLSRRVCVSFEGAPLGAALAALLRGTEVAAVPAAADHVVLAVDRAAGAGPARDALDAVVPLDRIVVTGSPAGGPQRALPYALDVLRPGALERAAAAGSLARVLNAAVPGIWGWEQSPGSLVMRYGSIRGASSFGVSHPKIFIDGIEVANPLLLSRFSPEAVERIEVIRGPQGAALYGTDAISGVVNIVSRHQGVETGTPRLLVRSDVGAANSAFASGATLGQDHALTLRTGSSARSAGLNLGIGTTGEFIPNSASRYLSASGNTRVVGPRSIFTGTLRFEDRTAGVAGSPLLDGVVPAASDSAFGRGPRPDSARDQSARQYTVGASLSLMPSERWTHSLVVGVDGGRLDGAPEEQLPVPYAAEGTTRVRAGSADRATMRASTTGRWGEPGAAAATLTVALEQSVLREAAEPSPADEREEGPAPIPDAITWLRTTGVVAQATGSLDDRLFVTAGLRLERNRGLGGASQLAALPVLGASLVGGRGDVGVKLRAAYGRGIRPVVTPSREAAWGRGHSPGYALGLEPEEQSGVEAGLDVFVGRALSFQATAYDQLASGLIQRVALPVYGAPQRPGRDPRRIEYALQNVGEISNRGVELQGGLERGALSLAGAFSLTRSVVRRLALGYTGDLRPGDRMLEVPERTASLTAAWSAVRWSGSLTAYRAWDWINYDRLALAADYAGSPRAPAGSTGAWLRSYWREYEGNTRLRAAVGFDLRPGLTLLLAGDNLLDQQSGEPDNLTVLPGRTLSLGARASF